MYTQISPKFTLSPELTSLSRQLDRKKLDLNSPSRIEMDRLMSFFEIPFTVPDEFLGKYNGWTEYYNAEYKITIKGGYLRQFGGAEFFSSAQVHGARLDNVYNDYITLFSLWNFLNDEGKTFLLSAYCDDIHAIKKKKEAEIKCTQAELDSIIKATDEMARDIAYPL